MKMTVLPKDDRPREKLRRLGVASLSDSELLALLLGSGHQGTNVLQLCQDLLTRFGGVKGLSKIDYATFLSVKGIGPSKACLLLALGELSLRIIGESEQSLNLPDAIAHIRAGIRNVEEAYLLGLDSRDEVIAVRLLSRGGEDGLSLSPKEVMRVALSLGGRACALVHTHPSGSPFPSNEDIALTGKLVAMAKRVGVVLRDHVIATKTGTFSCKENGIIE